MCTLRQDVNKSTCLIYNNRTSGASTPAILTCIVLSFRSTVDLMHQSQRHDQRHSPLFADGISRILSGHAQPKPGVWYILKLSASPTLRRFPAVCRYSKVWTYLTTRPFTQRLLLNMSGVIQSPFGIRLMYLLNMNVVAVVDATPSANAASASV